MVYWKSIITVTAVVVLILLIPLFNAQSQENWTVDRALKNITLKGYTRSITSTVLAAEVSGKVIGINYDIGQSVGKKAVIAIDATFIDFQVDQTRQSIRNLQVNIKRYQSRAAYLQKECGRSDKLFHENSTAESKRDSAAEDLAQAKFEIEALKTQMANLKIQLKELLERKRRHLIFAPQGWIVTQKSVEVGEIVQPGEPLAQVSDFRNLIIPLAVNSEELKAIKQLPRPFNAYLQGHPVMCTVNWINPEFNEKTRKLEIELILRKYTGEKRGGLVFTLPLVIASEGLRVPKAAVINRYENPRVKYRRRISPEFCINWYGNESWCLFTTVNCRNDTT